MSWLQVFICHTSEGRHPGLHTRVDASLRWHDISSSAGVAFLQTLERHKQYNALVILKVSLMVGEMMKLIQLVISIGILIASINNNVLASTSFDFPSDIFKLDTELCLVNASSESIAINNVWAVEESDWTGIFKPVHLLHRIISPYASECWPLTLVRKLSDKYEFNIEILTDRGMIAWAVKQQDAKGEVDKQYETLMNNTDYYLTQKAGDNSGFATNVFILEGEDNTREIDLANWMQLVPDHYTLKNIQLIGTHDAGVNEQDSVNCNVPSAVAVAQKWSLFNQLMHGIRYFDIRLESGKDNLHYPYHRKLIFGCASSKSFEQSLHDMIDFIKTHRSEVIFLKISHTSAPVDNVMNMLDSFTQTDSTGQFFYKSNYDAHNWTAKIIKELRGKIVLLLDCEFDNYLNPEKGYFAYSISSTSVCNADDSEKIIYDKYSNTLDFDVMYKDQLLKLEKYGKDESKLFLLSWTITGGDIIAHTPRPTARLAALSKYNFGKNIPIPNIIYYDFEDPGINEILVSNYLAWLQSCMKYDA